MVLKQARFLPRTTMNLLVNLNIILASASDTHLTVVSQDYRGKLYGFNLMFIVAELTLETSRALLRLFFV